MELVKVKDLNFGYNTEPVFENLTFSIPLTNCSIIGPSGSGKSTLLKILAGRIKCNTSIIINAIDLNDNNFNLLRKYFAVIFKDDTHIKDRVVDELRFPLENQNIVPKEIDDSINAILEYFDLIDIKFYPIDSLNYEDRLKIKILSYLIMNPRTIALDDLLCELDKKFIRKFFLYLKSNNIYLINVTSDIEQIIYTPHIICLYNKNIAFEGELKKLIGKEKLFKRLGLGLPFTVDLSLQLILYELINKIYFNQEELVEDLWK